MTNQPFGLSVFVFNGEKCRSQWITSGLDYRSEKNGPRLALNSVFYFVIMDGEALKGGWLLPFCSSLSLLKVKNKILYLPYHYELIKNENC